MTASSVNDTIQRYLEQNAACGGELGVQCAVWQDGMQVADCVAGWADAACSIPADHDTLFPVFSTGKSILSALILKLISDGRMELNMPLSHYWPEFTGNGRELVTIAHILTHTTGMFCMPRAESPEELADWRLMCQRLATMKPAWTPGTRTKYQALNYSWLLGEPVSRLTGKSLHQALEDELLRPLSLSGGIIFGMSPSEDARRAELIRTPDLQPPLPPKPTFINPTENLLREAVIRRATLPAFNGFANARSLCRFGAALLDARAPLLPEELLRQAYTSHRPDPLPQRIGYWERFGYGFLLYDAPGGLHFFGHGGYGGSELLLCPERKLVYAITRNKLSDDRRTHDFIRATLGIA